MERMNDEGPLSELTPIAFLQSFVIQSAKIAAQLGCTQCGNRTGHIEYLGLAASGCFEAAYRRQSRLSGVIGPDQYADMIISIKNQIGGNFSRTPSEPGVIRVISTRCPFGEAVKEAPELCRMTSGVFGGIAARNFGYANVALDKRIATNDGTCDISIYTSPSDGANVHGDEYHDEQGTILIKGTSAAVTSRIERKIHETWCHTRIERDKSGAPRIVAESRAMREALEAVEVVAPTAATVMITGETGVGKEIIARATHALSSRWDKGFIAINCGAIPENLIESALFGHERGAFTGAYDVHRGFFERAEKGTLFLDEIDSLPLPAQARLLRVLQEGEFERVGGRQVLRGDVRIIAASNRRLHDVVAEGTFRRDLFYRLNVVPIHIPPLRERREDLSELVNHFLKRLAEKYGTQRKFLSERAWIRVMSHDWPGNVRELENVLERSFLFAKEDIIETLRIDDHAAGDAKDRAENDQRILRSAKKQAGMELEGRILRELLIRHRGNVTAVARELGITARAVRQKLKSLAIDPRAYRRQDR